jgi:hypothetical protein
MLTARPSYGQSKWDSLQAVEKLIKSCILEKGKVHKNTHHLADLFALAEGLGVPKTDPSLIALVQCPPSVRYDAATVTKIEAFSAHGAALKICGDLALNVKRTTAHSEVSDYEFQFYHTKLRGLNLRHAPPAPPFIFVGWKYPAELLPNDVPALESIGNVACLYRPMIGASRQ